MAGEYYQKGFGLKAEVQDSLREDYFSRLVEHIRENSSTLSHGTLTIRLAKEFGFCYGVDRTIQYAYETRQKFPQRRLFITNEIIHNPHVNERLIELGMEFLNGRYRGRRGYDDLSPSDVVLIPAFGATVAEVEILRGKGCTIVDTTCGSVLNVWKNVDRYARDGYTAIIHGKHWHEETLATASQVSKHGGKYLVVRDMNENRVVCDYILQGGDKTAFLRIFEKACSSGFDPDQDLRRIGLANQTTMLSSESLEIERALREAIVRRHGEAALSERFRAFDTICTATQDRQDAIRALITQPLDLAIVVGGFNSSNTTHLAEICQEKFPTYHIENAEGMVSAEEIRHKIPHTGETITRYWLPARPLEVAVTAGASTPNNKVGEAIERLFFLKGHPLAREAS